MRSLKFIESIYQQKLDHQALNNQNNQKEALLILITALENHLRRISIVGKMLNFLSNKFIPNGVYLHGSVGTGKTSIVRFFINSIPSGIRCASWHINNLTHAMVLFSNQNKSKKIKDFASQMYQNYDVIFIDEFNVHDVAFAFMLRDLVTELISRGCFLIFTSNSEPLGLYKDGLQRDRVLPMMHLIEKTCIIHCLVGKDYRQANRIGVEFVPYTSIDTHNLEQMCLKKIHPHQLDTQSNIHIGNRKIWAWKHSRTLYADFFNLCHLPLSANDYRQMLSGVDWVFINRCFMPQESEKDILRRMVWLIDELYESGAKLVASFEYDYNRLQDYSLILPEISRAISRLAEMEVISMLQSRF